MVEVSTGRVTNGATPSNLDMLAEVVMSSPLYLHQLWENTNLEVFSSWHKSYCEVTNKQTPNKIKYFEHEVDENPLKLMNFT